MLRCLLVDDNPGFLAAARRLLERQGITVVGVASNSAEAVRRVQELRPEVVLVDIGLGQESGFELVGQLARQTRARTILVSTQDEEDYRDLIAASPAAGFLPKASLSARAIHELLAPRPCIKALSAIAGPDVVPGAPAETPKDNQYSRPSGGDARNHPDPDFHRTGNFDTRPNVPREK